MELKQRSVYYQLGTFCAYARVVYNRDESGISKQTTSLYLRRYEDMKGGGKRRKLGGLGWLGPLELIGNVSI